MKVVIDLPEWVEEKNIYVLAGIELVAYKYASSNTWNVKTSRCSICGACCVFRDGPCEHLKKIGDKTYCSLGSSRPFNCCIGLNPKNKETECTQNFDPVL